MGLHALVLHGPGELDQENWTEISGFSIPGQTFKEIAIPMDGKYEGLFFRIVFKAKAGVPAPAVAEFQIML